LRRSTAAWLTAEWHENWRIALLVAGLVVFFMPAATWNPVSRLALTRAIVDHGTLSIDADAAGTGDRARVGNHWYTEKAPLPALVAVVPYALVSGYNFLVGATPHFDVIGPDDRPPALLAPNAAYRRALYLVSLALSGSSALAVVLLLYHLLRRDHGHHAALMASMGVLCTPFFCYATSFYGHVPAAACLIGAVGAVPPGTRRTPARGRFLLAGALLGAAVGCEYICLVPAAVLGLWMWLRAQHRTRWQTLLDLGLGAAVPLGVVAIYHQACFGAPWRTGYSYVVDPTFAAGHAQGFMGLSIPSAAALSGMLFGAERGLFYLSPVVLLATGFTAWAAWRGDGLSRAGLAAACGLLIANAGYYMWWGGAAAGPRHFVPAIPFLLPGLAYAWRVPGVPTRLAVLLIMMLSFAVAVALCAVGLEAPMGRDILIRYVGPRLLNGRIAAFGGASNLGIALGLAPACSLGPILAWAIVGLRLAYRSGGHRIYPRPR
jgi:hypothetical protein